MQDVGARAPVSYVPGGRGGLVEFCIDSFAVNEAAGLFSCRGEDARVNYFVWTLSYDIVRELCVWAGAYYHSLDSDFFVDIVSSARW